MYEYIYTHNMLSDTEIKPKVNLNLILFQNCRIYMKKLIRKLTFVTDDIHTIRYIGCFIF